MFTKKLFLLPLLLGMLALGAFAQPRRTINYAELTSLDLGTLTSFTTESTLEKKGILHQSVITFNGVAVSLVDANVGGGTKIYTFPEGRVLILGATLNSLATTTTSVLASTLNTGVTLSCGVGSIQTTTQNSGTLATTQQDIIAAFTNTASTTINVAGASANGFLAASAQFNGTTTAQAIYLNFGVPTATDIDADATITATGALTITWINLGDY